MSRLIRSITDRIGRRLVWGVFSSAEDRPDKISASRIERRALYAEMDFLYHFYRATKVYGSLGIVFPFLVFILDIIMCGGVPNIFPGVIMELTGAWVLARAVLLGPDQIRDISTSGYGGPSPSFRKALAGDAADGIWGVSLLVAGMVLQSLAAAGIAIPAAWIC